VNLGLNLWLIPIYGATGAAWATLISNAVGFACWLVHPYTARFIVTCVTQATRPLAGVAAGFVVVAVLPVTGLGAAGVALATYGAVMAVSGGFSRSDLMLLRQVLADRAVEPVGSR
jgi:O-antigen/teichoic acid export membrane protein